MTSPTEQTCQTGVLSALRPLAGQHLAQLETEREERQREADRAQRELDATQRLAAERKAAQFIAWAFPNTLARALDAQAWQGYPPNSTRPGPARWACAVAYLGEGLFLHHTQRQHDNDSEEDVLTLIEPCAGPGCGAYVTTRMFSEEALCNRLTESAARLCPACTPF
ncbi:hypothetical protein DVA86_20500 [Streptomyces armeniacus]|uniref:Uncharacterized protein n=1 Tax=Streptomyces armeniacus TaxID=83291 RepID=A0A345XSQ9_9ACTN|nr:hypothetical protein [Streptomyces armeniacus]AXK34675.1 hypothetical protein DVA86_20500 [Streptomyces armeniacus]